MVGGRVALKLEEVLQVVPELAAVMSGGGRVRTGGGLPGAISKGPHGTPKVGRCVCYHVPSLAHLNCT
jgi:hypothetical protein